MINSIDLAIMLLQGVLGIRRSQGTGTGDCWPK